PRGSFMREIARDHQPAALPARCATSPTRKEGTSAQPLLARRAGGNADAPRAGDEMSNQNILSKIASGVSAWLPITLGITNGSLSSYSAVGDDVPAVLRVGCLGSGDLHLHPEFADRRRSEL